MQTIWILINSSGILLGVYRERKLADYAIKVYESKDADVGAPLLYLYEVNSDELNKFAGNNHRVVWMTHPKKF